jgi:hypothetical protein
MGIPTSNGNGGVAGRSAAGPALPARGRGAPSPPDVMMYQVLRNTTGAALVLLALGRVIGDDGPTRGARAPKPSSETNF